MVGAMEGHMGQSENLFATPARPKRLRIDVERLWIAGDQVAVVTTTTTPTKGQGPSWVTSSQWEGDAVELVVRASVDASLSRFYSSLWDREPKPGTYDGWLEHWGTM